jgi:hypothetical protein
LTRRCLRLREERPLWGCSSRCCDALLVRRGGLLVLALVGVGALVMVWLISTIFSPLAPVFHFIGDHRFGAIALLLVVAAAAAWVYVPVAGRNIAKVLLVVAVAAGFFDWGYSYRAAIDREASARAEAERVRLGLLEHQRREEAIAKARRDADAAEAALKAQQEEHAAYMREIEHASERNNSVQCLDAAAGVRLDKIGSRRKKAR